MQQSGFGQMPMGQPVAPIEYQGPQVDPMQQLSAPPLTEEIIQANCQVLAFTYGVPQLTPEQQQMVRQSLQISWQQGDAAMLNASVQGIQAMQMAIQQMPPQQHELVRGQIRPAIEQIMMMQPNDPMSQVIQQLRGQSPTPQIQPYAPQQPFQPQMPQQPWGQAPQPFGQTQPPQGYPQP
jgi:hypothetical protein